MTAQAPVRRVDLAVVGAGIIGLAHAAAAVRRGLSVLVLERDEVAVGASIRNFGHVCTTAQPSALQPIAQASREGWLSAASRYGLDVLEHGTLLLADRPEAVALLEEMAAARAGEVELLAAEGAVEATSGLARREALAGAARFPRDLRTFSRDAIPALAAALEADGVEFAWRHEAQGLEEHGSGVRVHTNRGVVDADRVIVCTGHDLDRLAPELADERGVLRCRLTMLRLAAPGAAIDPAILTTTSMLRYGAFAELPSFAALRASLVASSPVVIDDVLNVMMTQAPDGSLILGDSHHYGLATSPFMAADVEDAIRGEIGRLLDVDGLHVLERWQGVYASSPRADLVEHDASERIRFVTVASGIGMTLSFGLAERSFAD